MKDPTVNKASQFLNGKTTEIFIFFIFLRLKVKRGHVKADM